jgi:hypothetical protein
MGIKCCSRGRKKRIGKVEVRNMEVKSCRDVRIGQCSVCVGRRERAEKMNSYTEKSFLCATLKQPTGLKTPYYFDISRHLK